MRQNTRLAEAELIRINGNRSTDRSWLVTRRMLHAGESGQNRSVSAVVLGPGQKRSDNLNDYFRENLARV